jgi:nitrate/TMAO reductase-like tetraheme cytochrome c subunit
MRREKNVAGERNPEIGGTAAGGLRRLHLRSAGRLLLVSVAIAIGAGLSATVLAKDSMCLACHGEADAKGASGRSVAVDPAAFAKSVHGELGLDCTACHSDVSPNKIPHPDKVKPVDCASCHAQQVKEYTQTVHGAARKGGSMVAATCTNCHGKHDIRRSKDPASRTNHANLEATCGACHGNEKLVKEANLPGGNIGSQFHDSIHGKALTGAAQASAPTCTNCHGAHDMRAKGDATSRVNRARIPDTCGGCHQAIRAKFAKSFHGKLRQEGNAAAPVCTDCHSAHEIKRHDAPGFQTAVIEQCGNCHAQYLSTYRDTFHGQVTKLGYGQVATCASCHSAHDILPKSDPASTISSANRVNTCRKCHTEASVKFASFDPHANRHDKARNPLYWYAAKFMDWLLIGVFAFFGVHTLFWLVRLSINKIRGVKGSSGSTP